ncbi:MAG: succinate dehydrogenase/fumarate reductase iron-sulfur subunit [Bacteroidetes bacterium HGW-Bacteroidetes-6]|jgi:succinate dehydrogenase / fumarate reductase iron-sulfur subunit|nr:MAG: succinate dehydrogenase/fumarate reductase iron-sulfur subunit [Bacteroidetes bacterium HGW-Bacteroidetes-6]
MKFTLKIWRQKDSQSKGKFVKYGIDNISADSSFLEMLDQLNQKIITEGGSKPIDFTQCPVHFDHDCREGICGMCGLYINGRPHGPDKGITTCQLHMRKFKDGDTIVIEPWRSKAFPIIRDLVVDRSALDKIIQAGGYISVKTGSAPEANSIPVPRYLAEKAMDAAACIGCGACVAACPNSSVMLFVGAKVAHMSYLPQGKPESSRRVQAMVKAMDECGFGNCSNAYACEFECPKNISVTHIAKMNRDFLFASVCHEKEIFSSGN